MALSTQPTYVNESYNYDGQILRDITVGLLKFLNGRMYWDNTFETGIQRVNVPFYYASKPDDRYLLDAFLDDIPGIRPEGDYEPAPRVFIHLQSMDIKSKELTNPNVWVRFNKKVGNQLQAFMGKMQPVPIKCRYELKVQVENEIELFKYTQRFMDIIWYYHFYYFEHKFFRLDAVIDATDSLQGSFENVITLDSSNTIEITHTLDIHTYYPHTRMDKLIPANKRVNFKANLWDLTGSGIRIPKNDYDFLTPPKNMGDDKKIDNNSSIDGVNGSPSFNDTIFE
jgi:hypothetical protein